MSNLEKKRVIVKGHHPSSQHDQAITWLIKNVTFHLLRDLWLPNLTEWWVLMQAYYPYQHNYYSSLITCWSRGHKQCQTKRTKNVINSFSRDPQLSNLKEGWLMITSHMSKSQITHHKSQIAKWRIPLTMQLREVTWQMNFIIYLFLRRLLPLRQHSGLWN